MNPSLAQPSSETRMWLTALIGSLLLNGLILLLLAFAVLRSLLLDPARTAVAPPEEQTILIVPVVEAPAEPEPPRGFTRTSPEQASEPPERARFEGEHDTRAASDAPAVADAPELPSQQGEEAESIETTESVYQDGDLEHRQLGSPAAAATPPSPLEPAARPAEPGTTRGEELAEDAPGEGTDEPAPETHDPLLARERLAEGPLPIDRPVRAEEVIDEEPKPAPETNRESAPAVAERAEEAVQQAPKPSSSASEPRPPGFRGNQRKTRLKGSISRTGRTALDVDESALGRYHAAISRAIEQAWQRKCVQHRDYITPGVIRVRVVIDGQGAVRSVGTIEEFGIGTIQRGFTHGAIREASLPDMPAEIRRDLDGEPLELLYNFIF